MASVVAEALRASVVFHRVEIGAGAGQGLERRGGQKRDVSLGVGLANMFHRRQRLHEVAERAELDHQNLAQFARLAAHERPPSTVAYTSSVAWHMASTE